MMMTFFKQLPENFPLTSSLEGFRRERNGDVRSRPTKREEDGIRKLEFKLRRAKEKR
jgi:hypothetical protein